MISHLCVYCPIHLQYIRKGAYAVYNRFGEMRRRYLREKQRGVYNVMALKGTLEDHIKEVGESAQEMFESLIDQMKKAEGVTEQLKAENQMEWVGRMNNIRSRAEEAVINDLIYS